jgi:protein involved in polysaccharide export with SLBB domain
MKFYVSVIVACLFLGAAFNAQATNYKELGIERRTTQIKGMIAVGAKNSSADDANALEEEKKLLTQQFSIITGDEDTRYTVVPGDTLLITYQDQGKPVNAVYQVNANGEIPLPLAGNIKVSGLNRGETRNVLNEALSAYIRDPKLSVEVNAAGKYTVLGAAGPGVFEIKPNLRLLEALIKAGYDTQRTNLATVLVIRGGREKPEVLKLNLKKMITKANSDDNIPVKPGDLVYVPNTMFYDFGVFKDKVFEYILDYYTLGGATILKQDTGATTGTE